MDVLSSNAVDHPARRLAMPFLYGAFLIFALFSVLTVFVPLWFSKKTDIRNVAHRWKCLLYFACLGVGFMLIEISLIQRLTVFLGHPTYSFVVVLSTLLFASGLGSLCSGRLNPEGKTGILRLVICGVIALVTFVIFFVYDKFIDLMWLNKSMRITLAILTISPVGFLLGMCFPMGIQVARRYHAALIPWGWGINGACSVFASVLSLVLALNFGLKTAIGTGVVCYVVALVIISYLAEAEKTVVREDPHPARSDSVSARGIQHGL